MFSCGWLGCFHYKAGHGLARNIACKMLFSSARLPDSIRPSVRCKIVCCDTKVQTSGLNLPNIFLALTLKGFWDNNCLFHSDNRILQLFMAARLFGLNMGWNRISQTFNCFNKIHTTLGTFSIVTMVWENVTNKILTFQKHQDCFSPFSDCEWFESKYRPEFIPCSDVFFACFELVGKTGQNIHSNSASNYICQPRVQVWEDPRL